MNFLCAKSYNSRSTIVSPLPPPLASREPRQRPLSSDKPGRDKSSRTISSDRINCLRITWKSKIKTKHDGVVNVAAQDKIIDQEKKQGHFCEGTD